MKFNDFEKMQQNLNQMKNNLNHMQRMEFQDISNNREREKRRRAVQKKINQIKHPNVTRIARNEQMIVFITIAIVGITFIFSTSIFAKTISENNNVTENKVLNEEISNQTQEDEVLQEDIVLEKNKKAIQLENILMENVSVLKSKEYSEEERPLDFEIAYRENPNLPKDEQVITQEGIPGRQQVTVIKSYENNVFVSENILDFTIMENYIPQIIDVGTSVFLANNKVHLGDKMYTIKEVYLMDMPNENANKVSTILKSVDVTLIELAGEEWCKVDFDGIQGYMKCSDLTSGIVTPEIIEANRIQRIKMSLTEDMALNQSTNLTLEDYVRILSGNTSDRKKIIQENAEAFYNADKNFNMNGVFLASMAIHESGWGLSTIANDKKNLFGYGAYDSSPYASSFSFENYSDGINLVAKALVKYYINQAGTPIYEGEVAKGSYYNGPTVAGVNIRYASDKEWHNKVYKYMTYLYNRL